MTQVAQTMPIFTKMHDFLDWLVPATHHFPKLHRHTITRRLLDAALDCQEALIEANARRGRERLVWLDRADAALDKVRHYLRLVLGWQWLNPGQHEHAARMVAEIGRLLGGWRKVTQA